MSVSDGSVNEPLKRPEGDWLAVSLQSCQSIVVCVFNRMQLVHICCSLSSCFSSERSSRYTILSHYEAHANANLTLLNLSRKAVTLITLWSLLSTSEIAFILLDSIRICDNKDFIYSGQAKKSSTFRASTATIY
jgi:hypothetical protein